jgi:hypothetical protein
MRLVTGVVVATVAYLLVCVFLVLVVQACVPGEVAPDGRVAGGLSLVLDLAAQAIACLAAGAVALRHAQGSVTLATATMGGAIFAIVLACTLGFWSLAPAWYNWAIIVMTLPFVALGAAWRRAAGSVESPGRR